jgi:hypothetical protein
MAVHPDKCSHPDADKVLAARHAAEYQGNAQPCNNSQHTANQRKPMAHDVNEQT